MEGTRWGFGGEAPNKALNKIILDVREAQNRAGSDMGGQIQSKHTV